MDWHELEKMKVTELRDLAKDKYEITGVSAMNKATLVETLAQAMGIDKPHKVAAGSNKSEIKKRIRELKKERNEALAGQNREAFLSARKEIHKLRHKLRKMARLTT